MAALPGDSAPVTTCSDGYFPTKGPKLELLETAKNEAGHDAEQAAATLKNKRIGTGTETYKT